MARWRIFAGVLLAGLAAVAAGVTRLGAGPVSAKPTAEECALVAEVDAARWREMMQQPYLKDRGVHFVKPFLSAEPRPWRPQADDDLATRIRLWTTALRHAGEDRGLNCAAAFAAAGLAPDPGFGARPGTPGLYTEVMTYSRVRFSPDMRWALMTSRTCEPKPRSTGVSVDTTIYERRGGRWTAVASDSAPIDLLLTYYPWAERCESRTMRGEVGEWRLHCERSGDLPAVARPALWRGFDGTRPPYRCPLGARAVKVPVCQGDEKPPQWSPALERFRREAGRDGSLFGDRFEGHSLCADPLPPT